MKYLHTMVRVENLEASLNFYVNQLGLRESDRIVNEKDASLWCSYRHRATTRPKSSSPTLGSETLKGGRNFGHLAYRVDDIYATCARLMAAGCDHQPAHRGTGAWRSFDRPTKSRSSCCRRGMHCRLQSPGFRCRTAANGDASDLIAGYRRQAVLLLQLHSVVQW